MTDPRDLSLGPKRPWWLQPLFLACVVLPTLTAVVWFGLLTSDVYVSESRFIVRGQDKDRKSVV